MPNLKTLFGVLAIALVLEGLFALGMLATSANSVGFTWAQKWLTTELTD